MQFYGINPSKNYGRVIDPKDFFSEISKFFMIINPINPISLTITTKFYLIYLYGGFCIHELPSTIPPKLGISIEGTALSDASSSTMFSTE